MISVFDVLLRVIPSTATSSHGKRNEETSHDHTQQHRPQGCERIRLTCNRVDDKVDHDRRQNWQQRRNNHFLDRCFGQHINCTAIIRAFFTLHDAWLFFELAANFFNHRTSGAAYSGHCDTAEQEWQKAAKEQTNHHIWVGQ